MRLDALKRFYTTYDYDYSAIYSHNITTPLLRIEMHTDSMYRNHFLISSHYIIFVYSSNFSKRRILLLKQ